ncbi:P-loop containing nucleoside triphosphate hydrolase protein [Atractiella rhizophila]|nr:P-loop containing nucleoside triphosphate hydrolase protein [Atractiella rhizophila]
MRTPLPAPVVENGVRYSSKQRDLYTILTRQPENFFSNSKILSKRKSRTFDWFVNTFLFGMKIKTWFPIIAKFIWITFKLNPFRFSIHLCGSFIRSLSPALAIHFSSKLITLTQAAIDKPQSIKKRQLYSTALTSVFFGMLETVINKLLVYNDGVLDLAYESMIQSRLLAARARLDLPTLESSSTTKLFNSASDLLHHHEAFGFMKDLIKTTMDMGGLFFRAYLLTNQLERSNLDLAFMSLLGTLAGFLRWTFRGGPTSSSATITDPAYHRLQNLYNLTSKRSLSRELRLFNLYPYIQSHHAQAQETLTGMSAADPRKNRLGLSETLEAVDILSRSMVYVAFALKAIQGKAHDFAKLTLLKDSADQVAYEIWDLIWRLDDVKQSSDSIKDFFKLDKIRPKLVEPEVPQEYKRIENQGRRGMKIEFRDVVFGYPSTSKKALNGTSFTIQAGETVCVAGYNGAGKSTIINLITRLYDPSSGTVLINDVDIREYSSFELREHMMVLLQDGERYDMSLAEWIGLGNPSTLDINSKEKRERVEEAIVTADAKEVVEKLPKKADSILGPTPINHSADSFQKECIQYDLLTYELEVEEENGEEVESDSDSESGSDGGDGDGDKKKEEKEEKKVVVVVEKVDEPIEKREKRELKRKRKALKVAMDNLRNPPSFSGGEWQKLSIARSFMRSTDLCIFDEVSSALDPLAESKIFDEIFRQRGKQTTIYITHRMHSAPKADRIIMLSEGKTVETGTHEQLMRLNGKYAEMFKVQADAFKDEEKQRLPN